MRKVLRPILGVSLVLVGIVGLILPVMPGWIFVIPGLVILGDYFPPVRRLLDWAKAKARIGHTSR
ncbi:MAG TPA: PGPGW domain-containing protein [Bryobacteraceae bacterium]|nr:PGPGW domain-containing protein [Bryobacteraceae bacterium]